jgi:hypothetical protein
MVKKMKKTLKNYRHGDLALIGIEKLPSDIEDETASNVIMKGSHQNEHTATDAKIYLKDTDGFVFGYMVAGKDCLLHHVEHGVKIKGKQMKDAYIEPGVYELRKQHEDTHDGMKQVID